MQLLDLCTFFFRHHCLRVVNGENPFHWKNQQPDGEGLRSCVFSELFYSEAFPRALPTKMGKMISVVGKFPDRMWKVGEFARTR